MNKYMFKQTGTLNFKFISVILFAVFLVGGFLIKIPKINAENIAQPFPYSLSQITSYTNIDGGISTIMRVGCLPGSGDVYDINKGTLCPYITSTTRIGCILGSGDKYDINTGTLCLYGVSNVRIGCAVGSPHKYDINTGKLCTNKPISGSSTTPKISVNPTNTVSVTTTTTSQGAEGPGEVKATVDPINPILSEDELTEEIIDNNLTSSKERINSIFTWPMSTRTIALIIILILGIGYGIYSFMKKDKNVIPMYIEKKDKKSEAVKPTVKEQHPQKPQEQHMNTNTQNKIPNTPMTPPQNTPNTSNSNPQIPLNIPDNSGPF